MSGDSAEFQLAAPLLGVPHPTTYPLYILLGKLATLLLPFGDLAWRVTLVSALCAALAVALFALMARRLVGLGGAVVAALALGVTPGLWNAATLAEVYALLAALLAALGWLLATAGEGRPTNWRLYAAAFVAGLGCTHHGLFVLTGLPLFVGCALFALPRSKHKGQTIQHERVEIRVSRLMFRVSLLTALCFAAGLTPWLYPLVQFARYGPFDGVDYGLPRHYFWGAPQSWPAVL
ncbi:MAG TPA: DUF2723 domain-containing protein, partial [Roseiflexaceae bacterium]|nr:DUF2723 domain-containing protein [Roseiflexaceae bacterium]